MSSSITVSLLWFQTSSKARRTRALFWSDIVGSFPSGSSREGTAAPHLSEQQASELLDLLLKRYRAEMKQTPQRVVIHKTSRYWPAEGAGLQGALNGTI